MGGKVHVMNGSEFPLVLRKMTFEPDTATDGRYSLTAPPIQCTHQDKPVFQFISTTYIHGIMDGEVMKDQNARALEGFLR